MTDARDTETIKADVARLIDEARQAGYAEGYRDAVRNIVAAATDAAPSVAVAISPNAPLVRRSTAKLTTPRAPWGASRQAINAALDRYPHDGIDMEMVLAAAVELRHSIAESSLRSMIGHMVDAGEIARRSDGRWHRVHSAIAEATAFLNTAERSESDRPAEDNNGEQRWTSHPDDDTRSPRDSDLRPGLPEGRAMREVPEAPHRMVG